VGLRFDLTVPLGSVRRPARQRIGHPLQAIPPSPGLGETHPNAAVSASSCSAIGTPSAHARSPPTLETAWSCTTCSGPSVFADSPIRINNRRMVAFGLLDGGLGLAGAERGRPCSRRRSITRQDRPGRRRPRNGRSGARLTRRNQAGQRASTSPNSPGGKRIRCCDRWKPAGGRQRNRALRRRKIEGNARRARRPPAFHGRTAFAARSVDLPRGLDYITPGQRFFETFLDALAGIGSVCCPVTLRTIWPDCSRRRRCRASARRWGSTRLLAAMEELGMIRKDRHDRPRCWIPFFRQRPCTIICGWRPRCAGRGIGSRCIRADAKKHSASS